MEVSLAEIATNLIEKRVFDACKTPQASPFVWGLAPASD
jgi:hypothetical protein